MCGMDTQVVEITTQELAATITPAFTEQTTPEAVRKSLPMLPWFPASFLSSTRGWSVTARGIYRELLDCQWEQGGLPSDPKELQALIGATRPEWKEWPRVESKFPVCADGRRRNPRLERHRLNSIERSHKAHAAAQKRWCDQRREDAQQRRDPHANS
jgi:uncharacterized protein YdaU (DUF1376 family)